MGQQPSQGPAGVHIPTLLDRERVPQEAIDNVVRQITLRFHPRKIILFGSYSRGNPRPTSDVDLLVVLDTTLREVEQAVRICQALDYHFALDLHVRTPTTLARRLELGDPFLREAVATGKVLYAAPDC